MPRPDGDTAAVTFLCFLLLIAVIAITAILARTNRDFVENAQQKTKTSRAYCDAKIRALGHLRAADSRSDEGREKHDSLDSLCVGIRQAEAAEDAADYALSGLVLVLFATIAAGLAAAHTRRQANIAEAAYRNLERPYVVETVEQYDGAETTFNFGVRVTLRNYGRTPAIIEEIHMDILEIDGVPDDTTVVGRQSVSGNEILADRTDSHVIFANLVGRSEPPSYAMVEDGHLVWLVGKIVYDDPNGARYSHQIEWLFDPHYGFLRRPRGHL